MVYMVEIARFSRSDNRSCAIVGAESNSLKLIGLAGEVYKSKAPVSGDIYVISQHTHTHKMLLSYYAFTSVPSSCRFFSRLVLKNRR